MPFTSAQFQPKENPMSDVDPDVPEEEEVEGEEAPEEPEDPEAV